MRECTLWKSELIHPLTGVSKTPLLEKNHQRTMSTDGEEIFILMGGGVSSEMLLKRWLLSSECGFGVSTSLCILSSVGSSHCCAAAISHWLSRASCASFQHQVQLHRAGSLTLVMLGVFIPQELVNSTSQSLPSPPTPTPREPVVKH